MHIIEIKHHILSCLTCSLRVEHVDICLLFYNYSWSVYDKFSIKMIIISVVNLLIKTHQ